jgi:hypothetical protein
MKVVGNHTSSNWGWLWTANYKNTTELVEYCHDELTGVVAQKIT